jgi:hypothetical protein
MKNLLVIAVFVASASSAFAFSDIEIREKWSDQIMSVKNGVCKDHGDVVRKKLLYAASLIMHGEYVEARESIKTADEAAGSKECKEAIAKVYRLQK